MAVHGKTETAFRSSYGELAGIFEILTIGNDSAYLASKKKGVGHSTVQERDF